MFYTINGKKILCILFLIMLGIVVLFFAFMPHAINISNNMQNENIAWGFVRGKDHKQPEFSKKFTDILEKHNGIYIGNDREQVLYLTFDEGYENGYTSQILDILKENNVSATFFITGDYVKKNHELIFRMIEDGHILGNHSMNHPSFNKFNNEFDIKNEILSLHEYVLDNFEYEMEYYRPPKGEYNEYNLSVIESLGYKTVLWSFAYDDWDVTKQNREVYCKEKILSNVHNGAVILLHAVSKDNANILNEVLNELQNEGYVFKSLDDY